MRVGTTGCVAGRGMVPLLVKTTDDVFEGVGPVGSMGFRARAIDTAPLRLFHTAYLNLLNEPTAEHGRAMQAFLSNVHYKEVLAGNALYQIPPYQGAVFDEDWQGAVNTLNNWMEKGSPSEGPFYTMLCEFINNVHYWCPHPETMLQDWSDIFADPAAMMQVLIPYAVLFCANPYFAQMFGVDAEASAAPVAGAVFKADWLTAVGFVGVWQTVFDATQVCALTGPLMDGLNGAFQRLVEWCVPSGVCVEPVQALSLRERCGVWAKS